MQFGQLNRSSLLTDERHPAARSRVTVMSYLASIDRSNGGCLPRAALVESGVSDFPNHNDSYELFRIAADC